MKGLPGTIIVLRDGGYADPDILRWLFAEDDRLPGSPIASLRAGRHREVKRRAQADGLLSGLPGGLRPSLSCA